MKYTRRNLIRSLASAASGATAAGWIWLRADQTVSADSPVPNWVALPEIPVPKSDLLQTARWLGNAIRDRNDGDVWSTTWAADDNLYSVADDTQGWNLSIYRVEGVPPRHKVTRINEMREYDKAVQRPWWKGAGLASIDGVLYLGIYSQSNPSRLSASRVSFNADHSSIIKSADHGKTWSGSAKDHLAKPMFPKKEFPTPFFVQYGKDYAGAMDEYVYLCSNDGGWNNWNRMMLARVLRTKFGGLDRRDWEFFVASDGQNNPRWTTDVSKAGSIFEHKLHTSMTGIQYVPAIQRFVMGQWSYVAMQGQGAAACEDSALPRPWPEDAAHGREDQTMLCLYEAPRPWGPWKLIHAETPWGPSYYNPSFPAKWFEDGGKRLWIVQSGNYRGGGGYQFITQQMEWRASATVRGERQRQRTTTYS